MSHKSCFCTVTMVAVLFIAASPLHAQWITDGAAIITASADQQYPQLASDGADGAIIAWEDWRTATRGIGVTHINAFGYVEWTYKISLCASFGDSLRPQIISDGAGGAIVTWHDSCAGNYDIYAQRIDATGNPAAGWPLGGLTICNLPSDQIDPMIVSDEDGGAIIAWEDERWGIFNIYAQRVVATGSIHVDWPLNGVAVCLADTGQNWIDLATDGEHGAIITWVDWRDEGIAFGGDIYAQRVRADGTVGPAPDWPSNGAAICIADNEQVYPKIISDDDYGAIITWSDKRVNNHDDIYAQRVDADGNTLWTLNGRAICIHDERQRIPELTSNGAGGAIITWMDRREGEGNWDIYVNEVYSNGDVWDASLSGACVACTPDDQRKPKIVTDGANGAIIIWRQGPKGFYDLRARRVLDDCSMSAEEIWPADGVAVSTAYHNQLYPQVIPSGISGALVVWHDYRNGSNNDVYAQRIPPPSCDVTYDFTYTDDLWQDEFFFGCPQGDGYTLRVALDFDDAAVASFFGPGYTIPASEITLDRITEPYILMNAGEIIAQEPAYAPSYTDTITHSYASGCGISDVPVRLIGMVAGNARDLAVRSPDYTGSPYGFPDSLVNLSDLAAFGLTYLMDIGDADYNACFDFNPNDTINLSDLALFGLHYQHVYPHRETTLPPIMEPGPSIKVTLAGIESIESGPDKTILATLTLADARDITTMALGIDRHLPGLIYQGWSPNPAFPGTPVALATTHDDHDMIFIAVLNMNGRVDGEIELGTIAFAVPGDRAGDVSRDGLPFVFAEALDGDGTIKRIKTSGIDGGDSPPPLMTRLGDNYPNPFNPMTTIEYSIARDAHVNLTIYNVNGERVCTLVDEYQKRDSYSAAWNGTDMHGKEVASGVYFYRLKTNGFVKSKKLVLLR